MKDYNIERAVRAQLAYCEHNNVPMFAPKSGVCSRCFRQIFMPIVYPDGCQIGISVEYAANNLITGCPFCYASFCD